MTDSDVLAVAVHKIQKYTSRLAKRWALLWFRKTVYLSFAGRFLKIYHHSQKVFHS